MGAALAATGAEAGTRCPKCRRIVAASDRACRRCGLLASNFTAFSLERDLDPSRAAVDVLWATCRASWNEPVAHEHLIDRATRLCCLPGVARRYRELLEVAPDPVAEKRLNQIAVLIETAARAQAHDSGSSTSIRVLWLFGYLFAAALLAASIWVLWLAVRPS